MRLCRRHARNHPARRFYAAMGGRRLGEWAYVWDDLAAAPFLRCAS